MIIKHTPEDFIVEEIMDRQPAGGGQYLWFTLQKRDHNTLDALQSIGKRVGAELKAFGYAGSKDKRAVTTQTCSVKGKTFTRIELPGITATAIGQSDRPVSLGTHAANRFIITIRDIDHAPQIPKHFRNLFGQQRFSTTNADIGKAIIKRDFKTAATLIAQTGGTDAAKVAQAIEKQPTNPLAALRTIHPKKLAIYVHAYQSEIWNRCALKATEEKTLPIVGFGSENMPWLVEEELHWESITPRDFIIKEMPELSGEGGERNVWCEPTDTITGGLEEDEQFPGKKKILLRFTLPKGCYATTLIEQLVW